MQVRFLTVKILGYDPVNPPKYANGGHCLCCTITILLFPNLGPLFHYAQHRAYASADVGPDITQLCCEH